MGGSIHADKGTAAHWVLEQCLMSIYQWRLPMTAHQWVDHVVQVQDGPHADLSPSGSKRWMTCASSVHMEMMYPEKPSEDEVRGIQFTQDDANAVQEALDYVERRVAEMQEDHGPVVVRTEHRVSLSRFLGHDHCDGTCDIALVADGYIEAVDYKHGAGVPVSEHDPQLEFYLAGLMGEYVRDDGTYPFNGARRTVIQPRCDKISPRIRSVKVINPYEWSVDFIARVNEATAAVEAAAATPDFNPSEDACRFCAVGGSSKYNGNPVCKTYADFSLARVGVVFPPDATVETVYQACESAALQDTRTLTAFQIRGLLDAREMLTGMLSAVEAWALEMLKENKAPREVVEAYKLVRGRSQRRWAQDDEADTIRALKRIRGLDPETGKKRALKKGEIFVDKLDSPAGIERRFKGLELTDKARQALQALITKPEGKLTIAPISDAREAVVLKPVQGPEAAQEMLKNTPETAPELPVDP